MGWLKKEGGGVAEERRCGGAAEERGCGVWLIKEGGV